MSAFKQIRNTGLASLAALSLLSSGAIAAQATTTEAPAAGENVTLDLVGINDFHGRIAADRDSAGAAVVAGAVDAQRAANPNTLFLSAGDNIGASTFASASQEDEPTIDSLVAGGLDAAAVGNHEFDGGYEDLSGRVIKRYGQKSGMDGADYALGANVYDKGTKDPALREYAIREVDGLRVGIIGTVTADVPSLVSPNGISSLDFGSELEAANRVAAQLSDGDEANGEADVLVLLTHNGSENDTCEVIAEEDSDYGTLIRDASPEIDAIFSGHTHQAYNCDIAGRSVIQSHQYGTTLGKVSLELDATTGDVVESATELVALATEDANGDWSPNYEANVEVQGIVDDAVDKSEEVGSVKVGQISEDILRGGEEPGSDRGVESTLGNTVADIHLWATSNENFAGEPAEIAFMNPGGLRADLLYGQDGTVTYKAAADVQPFANTLITFEMTGEQIREALEQQWQPEGSERTKLHLGISEGLEYTYVEGAIAGEHIKDIAFNGEPLDESASFKVAANAFLATGGDNFAAFAEATGHTDSGQIDLDATVNYFKSHDVVSPAPLGRATLSGTDWASVEISPSEIVPGESAQVSVMGLEEGAEVTASAFDGELAVAEIPAADAEGKTSFELAVPADAALGANSLVLSQVQREDISVDFTVIETATEPTPSAEPTEEPSQSPSEEPSQSPSQSPSATPSEDSKQSPSEQPRDKDSLADTGFAASWIGIAAGVVLVAGIILLVIRSRKKNTH
ncbi:bifunctional metallophosphatase/5'-nucleotidase [Arthrobacter sp. MYb224]|uniref:bifunctional metallophosphatase/5'-nucleotidase n=1 Tax=Micrococcaceae TaxID=1268 RepID=UPI000CFE09AB|nr:bifunctional UDP-sugar hydrolase/5'-nucleotidase [Arthrobacter sp. MYb224]PQZ98781.1 bifunctional metallophosphatase/5'-nucleotidase [Arthrobacter sp. MYb224]